MIHYTFIKSVFYPPTGICWLCTIYLYKLDTMADQYLDKGTWLPVQQTQYYSSGYEQYFKNSFLQQNLLSNNCYISLTESKSVLTKWKTTSIFKKCKTTLIFQVMEDALNFQEIEDDLNFSGNSRRPHFKEMEDDLHFSGYGRQPQFLNKTCFLTIV
jgi:hypothetical protein